MNCNPMLGDEAHQLIRRLNELAKQFMRQRMFALEDLCQAGIDYCYTLIKPTCLTCGDMDFKYYFNSDHECKHCYRQRMYNEYQQYKGLYRVYPRV